MKILDRHLKLAPTPKADPLFTSVVKSSQGGSVALADPTAVRGLLAIMDAHAVNGGAACHWGGPAGFAEIMSAIHGFLFANKSTPWYEQYNFVNDAGHCENAVYATRALYGFDNMTPESLWTFRSITSKLTGHGEAHVNPEGVLISNGPLGSSIGQAQGLAFADKLAQNQRITICTISDGACMEGEAKESLASIPGLAAKGKSNPFVLCISDNNTKLSGRIDSQSYSMIPTFKALAVMGWEVIEVEQGNHLQEVYTALEKALAQVVANPQKPIALWYRTVKGIGVKSTVESASGGHGYPLKKHDPKITAFVDEIFSGKTPQAFAKWVSELTSKIPAPSDSKPASTAKPDIKVQVGISNGMIRAAKEGYPVFSLSADLAGSTGTAGFQKEFPTQSQDFGVAESNIVNIASGMSKQGFIPVVDTFAQFGVTKGKLPLTMAVLSQCPVIAVYSHVGLQDAADGASHQATTYFSALASIPDVTLISVSTAKEAEEYMYQGIKNIAEERKKGNHPPSLVFYLGRENFPEANKENLDYTFGKAQVIREGNDLCIVATGAMVLEALEAAEELKKSGVQASVVNHPFINQPDVATIGAQVTQCQGKLITLEDHQVKGGMGALLHHALGQAGIQVQTKSIGIPGHFGRSAYYAKELYQSFGMDGKSVAKTALSFLNKK